MLLKATWRSTRHHYRLLIVILLACWLFAGFATLIPLLLETLSESVSRRIIEGVRPEMTTLTLSHPSPFAPETPAVVDRALADLITDRIAFSRAIGRADYPGLGKICGYDYERGELLTSGSRLAASTSDHCFKVYSFAAPTDLFRLAEGRWPEALAVEPLVLPLRMGAPQVEAALVVDVAAAAGIAVGDSLVVGDDPERALVVEIVGLLEPLLPPEDVFWHGHTIVQAGEWTPYGDDMRYDIGLIVPAETFESWILPRYSQPVVTFHWWLRADPAAITSDELRRLDARLRRLERDLRLAHPQLELVSGLKSIAGQYQTEIDRFERVVWSLAGMVLILLAVQVFVIARLALDGARGEQAVITSRGASVRQRVIFRAATLTLASLSSIVMGPLLARLALNVLRRVGPLVVLHADYTPPVAESWAAALTVAGGLALLLTVAAWTTARFFAAHPRVIGPYRPLWSRYFLDLLLIAAGLAAVLRLYFSATGDLRQSIEALWQSPAALLDRIETSHLTAENGLGDPLNVAGPALLVVGMALLWLRLFPILIRLAGPVLRRQRGLAVPLGAWQAGRGVGRHTALVVMLVVALALGTASLLLDSTTTRHASQRSQQETGADVRLDYEQVGAGWETLPGLRASSSVMRLQATGQMVLLGIDPARSFPGLDEAAAMLAGEPSVMAGWLLPDDTAALQLAIFTPQEATSTTTTRLDVQLVDRRGQPSSVPMVAADPGRVGRFVIFRAVLPAGSAPWRLTGFRFRSQREGITMFSHQVYFDDLAAISVQGTTTVLEDFERATSAEAWAGAMVQSATAVEVARSTGQAFSGASSLRVEYRIRDAEIREFHPLLMVHEVPFPEIPLVISEAFADWQQRQSGTERRLAVGDVGRMQIELAGATIQFSYRVVGIVDDFPTAQPEDRLVVASVGDLQLILNAQSKSGRVYEPNQVWLALESTRPDAAFRQAAESLPGVVTVSYARDRYEVLRRDPAIKAVSGLLFAGFWFAWGLYAVTFVAQWARAWRDPAWQTLYVLGLSGARLRRLLATQQIIVLVPALIGGVLLGVLLVIWLLPFLPGVEDAGLAISRGAAASVLLMALLALAPLALAPLLVAGGGMRAPWRVIGIPGSHRP